jgi:hypothetical protein
MGGGITLILITVLYYSVKRLRNKRLKRKTKK